MWSVCTIWTKHVRIFLLRPLGVLSKNSWLARKAAQILSRTTGHTAKMAFRYKNWNRWNIWDETKITIKSVPSLRQSKWSCPHRTFSEAVVSELGSHKKWCYETWDNSSWYKSQTFAKLVFAQKQAYPIGQLYWFPNYVASYGNMQQFDQHILYLPDIHS